MTTSEYWKTVHDYIISNVRTQGDAAKDESPTAMFMTATREMLISGAATVVDITPGTERRAPGKGMVGYCDATTYYFLPDALYGAVTKFYTDQNRVYPLSKSALFKIMCEDGIVEQWDAKAGKTTRQKIIGGKNARYLWIPRWRVDGGSKPAEPSEQMTMQGFEPVEDGEMPWKEEAESDDKE